MEFALSEEQQLLVDSVGGYCTDHVSLDVVRACTREPSQNQALKAGLAEMGLAGILVPESAGGSGLELLDAALVSEVLGYHVAPVSFDGAALAALALRHQNQDVMLEKIATGEHQVGIGLTELTDRRTDNPLTLDKKGLVSGTSLFVQNGEQADTLLLCTPEGDVLWVDKGAHLSHQALTTIDRTRHYSSVTCEKAPALVLAKAGDLAIELICAARVLAAADSLGAAQAMLDKAVAYSLERKQFNRVIGSFQAVKHLCAEMAAALEPCRAMLWYSAHCHQALPDAFRLAACHLKAHLSEVSQFVARTATEVHGGIGFTELMGLHFWFKRIGFNRQWLGGPELTRKEIARLSGYSESAV